MGLLVINFDLRFLFSSLKFFNMLESVLFVGVGMLKWILYLMESKEWSVDLIKVLVNIVVEIFFLWY